MTRFIDEHRGRFGVEFICRVIDTNPSTYYAARKRLPSKRRLRDAELVDHIHRVFDDNYRVYGARRVWKALRREGIVVARCTVERLMAKEGLFGVHRGRKPWTTKADPKHARPADLVQRVFSASRPNELWVADLTYVRTFEGFCYVAFVTDVFSRRIVGWQLSSSLHTDLPLDALEMALWLREVNDTLIHHSDRGSQYTSLRYSDRLAAAGALGSVGSVGDSYDNALAEAVNGTYKSELIHQRKWRSPADVELATARWVGWYNNTRLHSSLGDIPPAEFETNWHEAPKPSRRVLTPAPVI